MTGKNGSKPTNGLLLAGVLAGLIVLWCQKSMPVTAEEPTLSDAAGPDTPIIQLKPGRKYHALTGKAGAQTGSQVGGRTIAVDNTNLAADGPQHGLSTVEMDINGRSYTLELALTPAQEEKGLMYRTSLPEHHGMLFGFMPPRAVNFWMKNTLIPLDMVFLRQNKIVNIAENVPPCKVDPCPVTPSVLPVDMVVELPAGTARKDGITIGQPVLIKASETTSESVNTR